MFLKNTKKKLNLKTQFKVEFLLTLTSSRKVLQKCLDEAVNYIYRNTPS